MAVKIDIPGIGIVEAENAASEQTLIDILAALNGTSSTAKTRAKDEANATKAQREHTTEMSNSAKLQKKISKDMADGVTNAIKTVSLTAISMAARFATSFTELADNPIKAASETLNQLIDTTADVATGMANAVPFIGSFISALINAGAELSKMANNMFAEQLDKNIRSLQNYARIGTSFAGGMTEMQHAANSAGLNLVKFSSIVVKNREELVKLGVAGGDAALKLSNVMSIAAEKTMKAGKATDSLRTQMFKMGFDYEEQGAIFSSYMANQAAAGRLRTMTDKQIAEGTRNYARDLKVLADITGKDAKKAMEEARSASLLADIQAKLRPEELDKFQAAYSAMPESAKKGFLEFVSSGGKFIADQGTNIAMAQNSQIRKLIEQAYSDITDTSKSSTDVLTRTSEQVAIAAQTQKQLNIENGAAITQATRLTGAFSEATAMINEFSSLSVRQQKAVAKSIEDAEKQAMSKDPALDKVAELYEETQKATVKLEIAVNEQLGTYVGLLTKINEETLVNFADAIEKITGKSKGMSWGELADKMAADLNPFNKDNFKVKKPEPGKESVKPTTDIFGFSMSQAGSPFPMLDKGGSIPAGKVAIAGERGAEIVAGPAEVLSTKSTEKLLKSVDMLSQSQEPTTASTSNTQSNAKTIAKLDEMTRQLSELVKLMRDNVNHTARVAQNTN